MASATTSSDSRDSFSMLSKPAWDVNQLKFVSKYCLLILRVSSGKLLSALLQAMTPKFGSVVKPFDRPANRSKFNILKLSHWQCIRIEKISQCVFAMTFLFSRNILRCCSCFKDLVNEVLSAGYWSWKMTTRCAKCYYISNDAENLLFFQKACNHIFKISARSTVDPK